MNYSGRVTDAQTGEPLQGANVTIKYSGGLFTTMATDADGWFNLTGPEGSAITITHVGYHAATYPASMTTQSRSLPLYRNYQDLQEVVLTNKKKPWPWILLAGLFIIAATRSKK